jgi:hypothetical protein
MDYAQRAAGTPSVHEKRLVDDFVQRRRLSAARDNRSSALTYRQIFRFASS